MKKKHAPSRMTQQSMCGYSATEMEYQRMGERRLERVNWARCLKRMA